MARERSSFVSAQTHGSIQIIMQYLRVIYGRRKSHSGGSGTWRQVPSCLSACSHLNKTAEYADVLGSNNREVVLYKMRLILLVQSLCRPVISRLCWLDIGLRRPQKTPTCGLGSEPNHANDMARFFRKFLKIMVTTGFVSHKSGTTK